MWVVIPSHDQRVLIMIIILNFLFLEMKIRILTRSELRYTDSSDY
jgi:hypothetical protein